MLYNMRSAAAKLRRSYDYLSRLVRAKKIGHTREGKRGNVYFTEQHLADYLAANEVTPAVAAEPKPKPKRSAARHGLDYGLVKQGGAQ